MTTSNVARRTGPEAASGLAVSLPELGTAFAFALDAAEGREPGHAVKVAYTAVLVSRELGLSEDVQRAAFYAGLLHDVGVPLAAANVPEAAQLHEELIFGFSPLGGLDAAEVPPEQRSLARDVLHAHVEAGAAFLQNPWFPEATHAAVCFSHENWDGSGYPARASGEAIPLLARILRASDLLECTVSGESNPLNARSRSRTTVASWSGREVEPEVAAALLSLMIGDGFWLGFYDEGIAEALAANAPGNGVQPSEKLAWSFSEAVSGLIDVKAGHERGRGKRVADYSAAMASALAMSSEHVEAVRLAALWCDVGIFGVPNRILAKPDLLAVDEMQRMRSHPAFSQEVVERIPALRSAAGWIGAHHERMDGKGYPASLSGSEIATEAGILSVADAYVAMTSQRPYRAALSHDGAISILGAGAGTQWDPFLVKVLVDAFEQEQAAAS